MSKKRTAKKKNLPYASKDVLFCTQLIVGLIVFFSVYSQQLMGPFGQMIQRIGFFVFGDAISLLPWLLFCTSPVLIRSTQISVKRYGLYLSLFCIFTLTFIDSFFYQKTLTIHGEIPVVLTVSLIDFGARLFGDFGIRFLFFSTALIFGVLLFELSFSSMLALSKSKKKNASIGSTLKKLK